MNWWLVGAQSALSALSTSGRNKAARIQADSANRIRAQNNKTVDAVNSRNAVITASQRWAQQVRNSRVYEGIEKTQEALAVNFNRQRDARTRQTFSETIRQSEEAGRMSAAAAASGITGSVVDIINNATQVRNDMQTVARKDAERQAGHDFNQAEFDQRWAQLDQLDNTVIFDNVQSYDYGNNVAQQESLWASAAGSLASSLMSGSKGSGSSPSWTSALSAVQSGASSLSSFFTSSVNSLTSLFK